jgi:histidinol dehydrogenase
VTEIYRIGGAKAANTMAYGTRRSRAENFGLNAYVAWPSGCFWSFRGLLPGPSEVLVLADDTANPKFAAADLLAQAEHGSGHERVWLVTTSAKLLKAVEKEITKQLPKLARRDFIQRALDNNGWLIQVKSLDDVVALTNQLAPEHCEVMTRNARKVGAIVTAGAIFSGPVAYGAGRLRGRPESHAAHRRRGCVICRVDRGPISTPHERGGIQSHLA